MMSKQTWFTISGITGFTLPGMMEEPGCIAGRRIDACADRGRAHVDLADQRLRFPEPVDILEHSVREGVELLTQRHRHRILKLSAAHLDVRREFLALVEECRRERDHRQLQ